MPEPTISAGVTFGVITGTVPMLIAFGVPLGLRPDVLVAGFAGAVVAITLLNTVPHEEDTWIGLLRTTGRRVMVAIASSLTAGYLTPLALSWSQLSESNLLGISFAIGGGAQQVLTYAILKLTGKNITVNEVPQ
jgi:hypothetical protein